MVLGMIYGEGTRFAWEGISLSVAPIHAPSALLGHTARDPSTPLPAQREQLLPLLEPPPRPSVFSVLVDSTLLVLEPPAALHALLRLLQLLLDLPPPLRVCPVPVASSQMKVLHPAATHTLPAQEGRMLLVPTAAPLVLLVPPPVR